jgi:hypothetical protein
MEVLSIELRCEVIIYFKQERSVKLIKTEESCALCTTDSYPCLGDGCPNKNIKVLYCDKCGCEVDKLYWLNDEQLCEDCVIDSLEVVEWE